MAGKTGTPSKEQVKEMDRIAKLNEPQNGRKVSEAMKKEPKPPDPMRELAARAVKIAESEGAGLGSAITAPQAALIKEQLGDEPLKRFAPATLKQMGAYAKGGKGAGRDQLPDEAVAKIRAFCKDSGSRRIWPRKVAAMVLALEEARKK